jgi:hypothetical protein
MAIDNIINASIIASDTAQTDWADWRGRAQHPPLTERNIIKHHHYKHTDKAPSAPAGTEYIFNVNKVSPTAMPWLRSLVTGLSPRRPGFMPWSIHVGYVADKMALVQVFL